MSFVRPTLTEIVSRIQVDFVSRLNLVGAVLRRSMVYVLSRVIGGASHMLHGHLDWVYRQLFPDISEEAALVRQASVFGLTKTAPTFAKGTVSLTGTGTPTIPAGRVLIRSDGGRYTVDADVTIAAGVATAAVTAVVAGAGGTLVVGMVLTFESPIAGVGSTGVVASSTTDGTDQEKTEALRVRFLARLAEPPMGGTLADYIAWAKEVPGVTRVWVTARERGPGTITVRFVRDNDGTGAAIIPSAGEIDVVRDYLLPRVPAVVAGTPSNSNLWVEAPVLAPADFTIAVVPNTTAVKDAVTGALAGLFHARAPADTVLLSTIRTAIGTTSGLTDYTLTFPAANVTNMPGELPTLGPITWA